MELGRTVLEKAKALAHEEASDNLDTKPGNKVLMVASVSEQEQESKMVLTLSPRSHGRERRKNTKYLDYEMDEKPETQSQKQKRRGRAPKKSTEIPQLKKGHHKKATDPIEEGDQQPENQTLQKKFPSSQPPKKKTERKETMGGGDRETASCISFKELSPKCPDITPKVKRKTPTRKTPAKKTKDLLAAEAENGCSEHQPVETPKPKRKYMRKQGTKIAPMLQKEQEETPTGPEVERNFGRPRRSAAKTALKYLHSLAQEDPEESGSGSRSGSPDSLSDQPGRSEGSGAMRLKKRKCLDSDNLEEDEDFIPSGGDELLEDMEEDEEDLESELTPANQYFNKSNLVDRKVFGVAANGMPNAMMKPAWDAYTVNKTFREEHYSNWVFPEWVPSVNDWRFLPKSELEKYLPLELQSAAFKVSREGLNNTETTLQKLNRFQVSDTHPERLDMMMFLGGPAWALEWCPLPDGATGNQYLAVACHQGMDNQHVFNQTYAGHGLIQLWDMGRMNYSSRPEACGACLAYGLGQENGFVWQLKWCPAGAWEPPTCSRKAPFLPRLGLLAVAVSTGVVTIYSLPHPEALCPNTTLPSEQAADSHGPTLYQAKEVLTLKLGAFKAPHHDKSGQVLSMDWLPDKPHNIMAVGFYDGTVGLWDLSSCTSLLRVRDPSHGMTLLPYRCFVAHDNSVRTLCFCPASRQLMVTGGNDRMVKLWDLKRLYEPISTQRRNLTTEVCWPLASPGTFQAQEITYASRGLHGTYYNDLGYRNARSMFVTPRTATVWSLSFSDWCNSLVSSDGLGEVIFALLPEFNCSHPSLRRTVERRFPIYFTDVVRCSADECSHEEEEEEEEEGGGKAEEEPASNDQAERNREASAAEDHVPKMPPKIPTYQEAVRKYYLHYSDSSLQSFENYKNRAPWKRMMQTELKTDVDLDMMPLAALHKVRFNPNMSCHTWVASAGQAGLLRVHCLQNMTSSQISKQIEESQTQFSALYIPADRQGQEEAQEAGISDQPL